MAAVLILTSPRLPPTTLRELCLENKSVVGNLNYLKNCDSNAFLRIARRPSRLFEEDSIWQSRPGYPILGTLGALPFRAVESIRARIAVSRLIGRDWYQPEYDTYYAGFILVNWLILTVAAVLFLLLVSGKPSSPVVLFPLTILVLNGVTKGFFWTPHTQIFNVLIPVASCAVAVSLLSKSQPLGRLLPIIGFCCGLASLVNGAFVLVLLTTTVALVSFLMRSRRQIPILSLLLAWLGFVAPLIAWRQYVVWKTGSFYMHEISAYRQFVWILDSLHREESGFLVLLGANVRSFVETVGESIALIVVMLGVALALCRTLRVRATTTMTVELKCAVGSFLLVGVPFFALMGYYTPRLTWELAPPLLILLSECLNSLGRAVSDRNFRFLKMSLVVAAIGYATTTLMLDQTRFLADKTLLESRVQSGK